MHAPDTTRGPIAPVSITFLRRTGIGSALLLVMTACGGVPSASPTATVGPTPGRIPDAEIALQAGTHLADIGAPFPHILLDVPSGWGGYNAAWLHKNADSNRWIGLTFWDVDEVYADPCRWNQPRLKPGPSVNELVDALLSQPMRDATQPTDVTLGGYGGMYLAWSVPTDLDFEDCDEDPSDGEHYFESWTGLGTGTDRYQQGPGQVDELWILDVDGHRLVVDAMHMPGATAADLSELRAIVQSIRFLDRTEG